ncbi:MAG: ATP-dependent zinc metalloprotease FtsH [Mycobacteriales bacterium]
MSKVAGPGPEPKRPSGQAPPPERPTGRTWIVPLLITLAAVAVLVLLGRGTGTGTSYDYTTFVNKVTADTVKEVTISSNGSVTGTLRDGTQFTSTVPTGIGDTGLLPTLQAHGVVVHATTSSGSGSTLLLSLLPWLLFIGLLVWFGRRAAKQLSGAGGMGGFSRSKAKIVEQERPSTTFADVAGYDEVKREVTEVVDFLRNPERYRKVGAVMPKGILLVGPPGTGKTLLARAVAGQAGVPFLSVTGSSFMEMFVGVGASRVRDLFNEARKRAPAIVFIDEIDSVGQRRGAGALTHEEHGQTLDQLLAEMDGFDQTVGVVLLAATNRPDVLDPALLRPGRFDRQVVVPLPNREERLLILRVHARGKTLDTDVDLDVVARGTPGFSGADLANLVNEAAINAVRQDRSVLVRQDFLDARDRVLLGLRKTSNALLPAERRAVAVHEAGHAIVAALSPHGDPVAKVTILPTGQALGVTEQLPVDERHLYSESYLQDSLAIRMGGRAAELLVLGEPSTGATNDLMSATQIATRMVAEFGMSRALGPVGFGDSETSYLGFETSRTRPYAEATQRVIDQEVSALLTAADQRAQQLLATRRAALGQLADLLVERETVDGQAVYELLGVPREETIPTGGLPMVQEAGAADG